MTEERDMTEEGRPDSPASKTDKKNANERRCA